MLQGDLNIKIESLLDPDLFHQLVEVRRTLHQYPELSGEETQTAQTIMNALKEFGIESYSHVAHTGIIADLPGTPGVPQVILRADIDALPIEEETGLDFSSRHKGIMHACGHDGHTAMILGAAVLLQKESSLPAPVRLLFQPAEEIGTGASAVINGRALETAGLIFGGHLDRHYPTGTIAVSEGSVNASTDTFTVEIIGQGAHGARPHESIDAVIVASLMVMALQTIVSREVDPAHPSVVSVGLLQAGTAANVIAGRAKLEGTIRAQDSHVRSHLQTSVRRIAESIAQLHGAKIHVEMKQGTPQVMNTPEMTQLAHEAASLAIGKDSVVPLKTANMGGEDFSFYLEQIPGAYVRFGSQIANRENLPAHSSRFDFDERAIAVGAAYYYHIALLAGKRLLAQYQQTQK